MKRCHGCRRQAARQCEACRRWWCSDCLRTQRLTTRWDRWRCGFAPGVRAQIVRCWPCAEDGFLGAASKRGTIGDEPPMPGEQE